MSLFFPDCYPCSRRGFGAVLVVWEHLFFTSVKVVIYWRRSKIWKGLISESRIGGGEGGWLNIKDGERIRPV